MLNEIKEVIINKKIKRFSIMTKDIKNIFYNTRYYILSNYIELGRLCFFSNDENEIMFLFTYS